MADKPILFNTEMVQAIKNGWKTQTRRVCKGQGECNPVQCGYHPPYKPGDILWVRETWRPIEASSAGWCRIEYKAGGAEYFQNVIAVPKYQEPWHPSIHMPKEAARIFLRVKDVKVQRLREMSEADCMAEGIREFTKDGKLFKYSTQSGDMPTIPWADMPVTPGTAFAKLWDSTIKPADRDWYGWAVNPWVWVIEFERIEKPEGW